MELNTNKRILLIDYLSPEGHIHSTKKQIDTLRELGYEVYVIFREGYVDQFNIEGVHVYKEIPQNYYNGIGSHFQSRLSYIKILNYIKPFIAEEKWAFVINQCYEPFSLFLRPIFKKTYIVDHNTASDLLHPIKRHIILHLNKNYTHIVFNEYMKDAYVTNGISNVQVVPMGMRSIEIPENRTILDKLSIKKNGFIFSPSSSSSDEAFIADICSDEIFNKCLSDNNLKLVVKGRYLKDLPCQSNIILIDNYLSQEEYDCLMKSASLVLIAYPKSFTYRVSGVQLECITSNIKCLLSDISAFRAYEKCLNYEYCFFKNKKDLMEMLPKALVEKRDNLYINVEEATSAKQAWINILKK